ncbi:MAG: class I SAM-dependent methyltransferase [Actinomycetota bacterium]|nr:class I SAM-dependent methyltransferase [Actinomycetota bacterium]
MTALSPSADVVWHELECGGYRQDLPLWRSFAEQHGDPVLEIGAGTGRVTLDLARAGYQVTALERDATLLAELSSRRGSLPVKLVQADARNFRLKDRFALCIAPMQTVQLLGGPDGRVAFLDRARRHLREDGALAVAIVETLAPFRATDGGPGLEAEACERGGTLYSSRPTAVLADRKGFVLERRRETIAAGGTRTALEHSERIDRLSCAELEAEGVAAGLQPGGRTSIPSTQRHTGSEVVILRA